MKKAALILLHVVLVAAALCALVLWPLNANLHLLSRGDGTDAVSQASLVVPDQPSGEFKVLINAHAHPDTLAAWESFFSDAQDFQVIFEDLGCLVAQGDTAGQQLAERYVAQLPENQLRVREENPTLLASKIENGYIDVAVLSQEFMQALGIRPGSGICVLSVSGGDEADAQA